MTVDHAEHQGEVEHGELLKVPNASGKAVFWIIHAFDDDPDSPSPHNEIMKEFHPYNERVFVFDSNYFVLKYNPKSEKVGTVWKTQIKKESSDF